MQDLTRELRCDFTLREVVDTTAPSAAVGDREGVARRVLEYRAAPVSRATAVTRYAPGEEIPAPPAAGGEELLVLRGEFSDERAHYASGAYLRNASGGRRRTTAGCVLFEKTGHLAADDRASLAVDSSTGAWRPGMYSGLQNLLLAAVGTERTVLVRWAAGTQIPPHTHATVEETLVIEGELQDEFGRYPAGTWFRVPQGSTHAPRSDNGALILIKVGQL